MKAVWIVLAMIYAIGAWAQSQPPANDTKQSVPIKEQGGNEANKQIPINSRAELVVPLPAPATDAIHKVIPTATKAVAADKSSKEKWWDKVAADPNIQFNGLLVLFTLVLAIVSIYQGKLAREDFRAVHRPRIILRESYTLPESGGPVTVTYVLENTGSTKAKVMGSAFGCRYSLATEVKRQIEIGGDEEQGTVQDIIPNGTEIAAGAQFKCQHSFSAKWPEGVQLWGISAGAKEILTNGLSNPSWEYFFFGRVSYEDTNGIIRNMAFYRRLEIGSFRFIPFGDPQLEYADERP